MGKSAGLIYLMVLAGGLMVAGCGQDRYCWYQSQTRVEQAALDCWECYAEAQVEREKYLLRTKREAEQTHAVYVKEAEEQFAEQWEGVDFDNCMDRRGYRRVPEAFLSPSVRKRFCRLPDGSNVLVAGTWPEEPVEKDAK